MNAKLKQIDQRAEILANLYRNERISEARYLDSIKKLTDKAAEIMARG